MFEDVNGISIEQSEETPIREKKTPFTYSKSILETGVDEYVDGDGYNQFIINKAISFHPDCVFYVHMLSMFEVPDSVHYQYMLNTIDKKRRKFSWVSKDSLPEAINLIKEAYGYSTKDALNALDILSDKQLLELKHNLRKGGRL